MILRSARLWRNLLHNTWCAKVQQQFRNNCTLCDINRHRQKGWLWLPSFILVVFFPTYTSKLIKIITFSSTFGSLPLSITMAKNIDFFCFDQKIHILHKEINMADFIPTEINLFWGNFLCKWIYPWLWYSTSIWSGGML